MASRQSTVDFLLEQTAGAGAMTAKKMFGEYGLYCDGALVALVCEDQLFVKPTDSGRAFIGEAVVEGVAYPGAKPSFLISGDKCEDRDWLAQLVRLTAAGLALSTKKTPRRKTHPRVK